MPDVTARDRVYVVGHRHPDTDSVCSAIAYASLKQTLGDARVWPASAGDINQETRYVLDRFALPAPTVLNRATGHQLILVDHNETAQALDDIEHAIILEVWEHHRIGDLRVPVPILFHCEPVGATATLVAEQFVLNEVSPSPAIAGALLAGILSDTLSLTSPTTSAKDRRMVERLQGWSGVNALGLGRDLMMARGDVSARSVTDLIESDFKEFEMAGHRVGIAQVESLDVTPLLARRDDLLAEMQRVRQARGLVQVILLLTDVSRKGSYALCVGSQCEATARVLDGPRVEGATWVDGCLSRKKQVVPALELEFSKVPKMEHLTPSPEPGHHR